MEDDELTFVEFMIRAKRLQIENTVYLFEREAMADEVFRTIFSRDIEQLDALHLRANVLTQRRQCINAGGDSTSRPIAECLQSPNCSLRVRHAQDRPDVQFVSAPHVSHSSTTTPADIRLSTPSDTRLSTPADTHLSTPANPRLSTLPAATPTVQNITNSYDWLRRDVRPTVVEGGAVDGFIESLLRQASGSSSSEKPRGTSACSVRPSCKSVGTTSDVSVGRESNDYIGREVRSCSLLERDVTEENPHYRNGIKSDIFISCNRRASSVSVDNDKAVNRDSSPRIPFTGDASDRDSRAHTPTLDCKPRACASDVIHSGAGRRSGKHGVQLAAKRETLFKSLEEIREVIQSVSNLTRGESRTPRLDSNGYQEVDDVEESTTVADSRHSSLLDSQQSSVFEESTSGNSSKHSLNSTKAVTITDVDLLGYSATNLAGEKVGSSRELACVGCVDNSLPGGYLKRLFKDLDETKRVIQGLEGLISCGSPLDAKHAQLVARVKRNASVDMGMLARRRAATVACRDRDNAGHGGRETATVKCDRDAQLGPRTRRCTTSTEQRNGLEADSVSFSKCDDAQSESKRGDVERKFVDFECIGQGNIGFPQLGPQRSALNADSEPERTEFGGSRFYRKRSERVAEGKGPTVSGRWSREDEEMLMKKNLETIKSHAGMRREVERLENELAGIQKNVDGRESNLEYSDRLSTVTLIPKEISVGGAILSSNEGENAEKSPINKSQSTITCSLGDGEDSADDISNGILTEEASKTIEESGQHSGKLKVKRSSTDTCGKSQINKSQSTITCSLGDGEDSADGISNGILTEKASKSIEKSRRHSGKFKVKRSSTDTLIPKEISVGGAILSSNEVKNAGKSQSTLTRSLGDGEVSADDISNGILTEEASKSVEKSGQHSGKFKVERYLLEKRMLEMHDYEQESAERSKRKIWFGDKVLVASGGATESSETDVFDETEESRWNSYGGGQSAAENGQEEVGNVSGEIEVEQLYMNEKPLYCSDVDLIKLD